jgi:hypothetical protein
VVAAHFRGADAMLGAVDHGAPGHLVLRGTITHSSYPGGSYRYAVRVGEQQYLVDNATRLSIGEAVGIVIPTARLHLYPVTQKR